jgi:hypothetical protein
MVCSVSYLTSITSIVSKSVKLPNGKYASVTHIGTVKITETLILTDVLCVPSFSVNLISVSKLIKFLHCCIIFCANFCFIQLLSNWTTIGMGREQGGLFFLVPNLKHHFYVPMLSSQFLLSSHLLQTCCRTCQPLAFSFRTYF